MTDTYRIRSEETWAAARADYAAGLSGPEVCERHDIGLSAFRKRARDGAWRRADQPDPVWEDEEPDDLPEVDLAATAAWALKRMGVAIRRGRAIEALRWQRLHHHLSRRIEADAAAEQAAEARIEAEHAAAIQNLENVRVQAERNARIEARLGPDATHHDRLVARLDQAMEDIARRVPISIATLIPAPAAPSATAVETTKVHEVHSVFQPPPATD